MTAIRTAAKAIKLLIFNSLLLAALVAAAEFAVFCLYRWPPGIQVVRSTARYYYRSFEAKIITFQPSCAQYDSSLSYLLKPGSCTFTNPEYSTEVEVNSRGLRDDEDSLEAPEIIALGDSFTMGWGVEQQESFPQLLEQALGRKVLNTGIPSYGTAREFILFNTLDTSALKAVILQYNANDVNENIAFMTQGNKLNIMRKMDYEFAREQRRQQLRPKYYFGKYLKEFLPLLVKNYREPPVEPQERADKIAFEVDSFINVIQQSRIDISGVPVFVIETSSYNRNNEAFISELRSRPAPRLAHFSNAEVQLIPLDISSLVLDSDYYLLDSHWRPAGHRKIAALLEQQLRKHLRIAGGA